MTIISEAYNAVILKLWMITKWYWSSFPPGNKKDNYNLQRNCDINCEL